MTKEEFFKLINEKAQNMLVENNEYLVDLPKIVIGSDVRALAEVVYELLVDKD